ncbi:YkgJ family cysteine cluster protein [bacterium]|nr:YkgJ family cysteine cluster protein [bacterium]
MPEIRKFADCFECGGKCCRFIGIPMKYRKLMYTTGVPLSIYRSKLEPHPGRYFEIHEGITVDRDRKTFTVSRDLAVKIITVRREKQLIVYSRCSMLDENSRCLIYADRPQLCRNFDRKHIRDYYVPAGCIFDNGKMGFDYGV